MDDTRADGGPDHGEDAAAGSGEGPVFRDVDADGPARLVAMMDATDAWPAVQAARAWVLAQAGPLDASLVVDVGSGPGTFGREARSLGASTIDLDRSLAMLAEDRRRHAGVAAARADLSRLPVRTGAASLVRAERVIQWTVDPDAALAELRRITAPGGGLAVTDTDWGTFAVDVIDDDAVDRWSVAARRWVPHPTFARGLARRLADLGAVEVEVRTDAVTIAAWDPDDPAAADGPPGLPLRTIVQAARPEDRAAVLADVEAIAARARRGRFLATLTLVTAVGRF